MGNLSFSYKNFIITFLVLTTLLVPSLTCSAENEFDINDADYIEQPTEETNTAYINDIEILGSNIIKPEYILSKMSFVFPCAFCLNSGKNADFV